MKQNFSAPAESNLSFQLQDFFPYRLSILSNRISNLIATEYAEKFDLRVPEWRTIAVLYEPGQLLASEIADITLMDRVRVTRTIKTLLKKKLVLRRASQSDGRSTYIALTAAGRRIYEDVIPVALNYEQQVLGALTTSERKSLDTIMEKLGHRITDLDR